MNQGSRLPKPEAKLLLGQDSDSEGDGESQAKKAK